MTILVVGQNGFIGQAIINASRVDLMGLSHHASPPAGEFECVIYAGRDPSLGRPSYNIEADVELRWASWASVKNCHFIHLGSRKVYRTSSAPLTESDPLEPVDMYGQQKLAMENRLREILKEQLTIARIGNAFGYERGRTSFFGAMLERLAEQQEIKFDMSPNVRRDFVPVEFVARAILALADTKAPGAINVASGIPLETGEIATTLIDAYGGGQLLVEDDAFRDEFVLDIDRLHTLTGLTIKRADIIEDVRKIGERLRKEQG